eukprot:gene12633-6537_t
MDNYFSQHHEKTSPKQILDQYFNGSYWNYYLTTIQNCNQMTVKEITTLKDNSVIFLSENDMIKLNLFRGDVIFILTIGCWKNLRYLCSTNYIDYWRTFFW